MKKNLFPLLFLSFFLSFLLVSFSGNRTKNVSKLSDIKIVYTNDILGEIEPCGCRNDPSGGMLRKAHLLEKLKSNSFLQLDGGDLLFGTLDVPDLLKDQYLIQAKHLVKMLNTLKHDAVVPGEKDFALGLPVFDEIKKEADFKFLAANLSKKGGGLLLEPYEIFERKAEGEIVKIAVLGLVDETLQWPNELKGSPAIVAAKKYLPELKKKADFVIALTHQGFEKDKLLANTIKGFDIIIGGHSQSYLQNPRSINGTYIFQSSFKNQAVGFIPLAKNFSNKNHELTNLGAEFEPGKNLDRKSLPLTYQMREMVAEFKKSIAQFNTDTEKEIEQAGQPEQENPYQTFPKCAGCHIKQFNQWRKTDHARAMEPLLEKNQIRNKECLACHTLGLGKGGYSEISQMSKPSKTPEQLTEYIKEIRKAVSLDQKLKTEVVKKESGDEMIVRHSLSHYELLFASVQCESCHGAAGDHPFSEYKKEVSDNTCLTCHNKERAPKWYNDGVLNKRLLKSKRSLIQH